MTKERRFFIMKWLIYSLFIFILFIIQTSVLNNFRIAGVCPGLLSAAIPMIAIFEGTGGGMAMGILAGLLCDTVIPPAEGFFMLNYTLIGFISGGISDYLFKINLLTSFIWSLICLVYVNLLYYLIFYFITGRAGLGALITVSLPETLYSALFIPLVYLLVRLLNRKIAAMEP